MYKIVLLVSLVFASLALVAQAHGGDYDDRDVPGSVDFIVLGVGTSGSVVASQLAKAKKSNGHFKYDVLALDIGRDLQGKEVTSNPGNWQTVKGSEADWDITIASGEPKAFLIDADKRHITQGRVLGGSSAINSAMYVRGDPADYNRWGAANPGWSFSEVLPYFNALENNANKYALNQAYHGNSGPLFVNGSLYHPKMQVYLDAAANFGLTYNPDINGEHLVIGNKGTIGRIDSTVKDGVRQNAYQSFLLPIKDQDNIFLRDQAFVLKINFQGKVAKSVDWFDTISRKVVTTKARKEIIVSLGALRSPQALILSGVGAKAEVEAIDVPLVHNLPGVGKNLQDHPIATFSTSQPAVAKACEGSGRDPRVDLWFRTSFKAADDPRPDIETIGSNACGGAFSLVYLMNPKSRGYIRVTSADATSRPIPVMNYFNDPEGHDLKVLMEGMRLTRDYFAAAPLNAVVTTSALANSFDDWTLSNYILGSAWSAPNTNSGNHMAGTCKMGPSSDPTAVVDHRLRVHGVQRLRVIDNSIQPEITSGNTQAPAYLIGYKGAAMILEDNN